MSGSYKLVMPGLVQGIHERILAWKDVDGRDKPGQDDSNHVVLNCSTPSFVSAVSRPSTIM